MSVFPDRALQFMMAQVTNIAGRYVNAMPMELTTDRLVEAFVDPEDYPVLCRAYQITARNPWANATLSLRLKLEVGDVDVGIRIPQSQLNCLLPKYADGQRVPSFTDAEWSHLKQYVTRRVTQQNAANRVTAIIQLLNDQCKTIGEYKLMFPAIIDLADDQRKKQIMSAPMPKKIPSLTHEVRSACAEATTFINKAKMLPQFGEPAISVSVIYKTPPVSFI